MMRRAAALLAVFALCLGACGRYGPPVRSGGRATVEPTTTAGATDAAERKAADRENLR